MVCLSRGGTVLKKLFLDFSLDGAAVNPYMSLVQIAFLSFRLAG